MPGVLVRFGTKQRRRFEAATPEAVATLKEIGALIGREGVAADYGAQLLTDLAAGDTSEREVRATIKAYVKAAGAHKATAYTFEDLGRAWTSGEIAREHPDHVRHKATASKDAERLSVLCKAVGRVRVEDFTLPDAERAMRSLPKGLASATRRQYAQIMARLLALAVYPLRLIPTSPLPRGFLPKVTRSKATAWLYPAEDAALMACQAVPLVRRVLYGFLAREGLRGGEALALRWEDLDLVRGVIKLDENKTDDPRAWALTPGVSAALAHFRPDGADDGELVFNVLNGGRMADTFRAELAVAGITRAELFQRTDARQPIRLHDLRATFVTLSLAAGRSESWVADRTGHRSSVMINGYRRAARTAAELGLGSLAPLDGAVLWTETKAVNAGHYSASNPPPRGRRAG